MNPIRVFGFACVGAAIGFGLSLSSNKNKKLLLSSNEVDNAEGKFNLARTIVSGAIIGGTFECCPELCVIFSLIIWIDAMHNYDDCHYHLWWLLI
jgi:hypothetical protein